MEGPRALRQEEWGSLRALLDTVFRPGMPEQYPQLFNDENRENLRVCVDDGRCVSHVGMIERGAALFGCPVQVCCIGAVATLPEYRGRGLASACFDDAVEKAVRDGIDLMQVSGDRALYRRRGCLNVGSDAAFSLPADDPAALPAEGERRPVTAEPMTDDDLPRVMDCYRYEPVRFLRPPDDYHHARQSGMTMNRPSDFLVVREGGEFRGYVIVQRRGGVPSRVQIAEFAGDRRALLAALPCLASRYAPADLRWQVPRHDRLFRSLCDGAGLEAMPARPPGTVKLINFPQLMARMSPRWEELLGRRDAAKLSFWQQDEQYGFRFGDDALITDRDAATRLLFDAGEDSPAQGDAGPGLCAAILRTILPLPRLWYGINYV